MLILTFCSVVQAQELNCDWQADLRVAVSDGWIEAEQGRDENGERLRLAVWGSEWVDAKCAQLDSDSEPEVVITSRGPGNGSYYRLQIIDFQSNGIMTWAYSSDGVPKVAQNVISLGKLINGYQGAASTPEYTDYRFTKDGLIGLNEETNWILFMTVTIAGSEIQLSPTDQRSRATCEIEAQDLIKQFASAEQNATYSCMSNLDITEALEPFIN